MFLYILFELEVGGAIMSCGGGGGSGGGGPGDEEEERPLADGREGRGIQIT